MVYEAIKKLVQYGVDTGLLSEADRIYAVNQILDVLRLEEYEEPEQEYRDVNLEETLKELLDYACSQGIIEDSIGYRDLFDTRLMNCLMPRPSEVSVKFWDIYHTEGAEAATDYFYELSQDSDYIRRYRVCKDQKWVTETPYGIWILRSTYRNRRRIPRRLPLQSWPSRAVIRSACCAWRMRGMPAV